MTASRSASARARRKASLRGIGIGCYLEVTAAPGKELGAIHFEADGTVTIITGTMDFGMGHATTYAQILSDLLGIPFDAIRTVEGDSDRMSFGGGSGGSRSVMFVGTALSESSKIVVERGKQIASHVLEAAVSDIEYKSGRFVIAGTDRSIGLIELAARLRGGLKLPPDAPTSLDVDHIIDQPVPSAFPNGCHIAEVEVDPQTGRRSGRALFRRQRSRHRRQSAAGRRPDPRRHRAGPGSGADGAGGLRCRRAIGDRLVHGLRHAARDTTCR